MIFMSLDIILLALGMMSIVTRCTSSNFHDHQVVGDFVYYRPLYLDKRLIVIVKTPDGVTIPFEVLSCDNVLSLKRMITKETDIPVAAQTLLSDNTVLENTKSVGAYIEDGKLTLHCTLVSEVLFCSCL